MGGGVKAEEMYRRELNGYERSLGEEHELTKKCAKNVADFFLSIPSRGKKMKDSANVYPQMNQAGIFSSGRIEVIRNLMK